MLLEVKQASVSTGSGSATVTSSSAAASGLVRRSVLDRLRGKSSRCRAAPPLPATTFLPVLKGGTTMTSGGGVKRKLFRGHQDKKVKHRVPFADWDDPKLDPNNFVKNSAESEIYTDWANHYLEKARFRRFIQDLQADLADGVLLADVIDAVVNEKVPDVNRKPKSVSQMIDNINSSLVFLAGLGVNVDGLTARDIRDGNLKAILGLFFSLSRHKQQQKQQATVVTTTTTPPGVGTSVVDAMAPIHTSARSSGDTQQSSRLPAPCRHQSVNAPAAPGRGGGSTSKDVCPATSNIPAPPSSTSSIRKVNAHRLSGGGTGSLPGSQGGGGVSVRNNSSSRSTSPSAASLSFIPQPSCGKAVVTTRQPTSDKHPKTSNGSVPSSHAVATSKSGGGLTRGHNGQASNNNNNNNLGGKNSMLDKFKLFNSKDKAEKGAVSKRTSSSSGFSSARSERSDSSNSICSESKGCSSSATTTTTTPTTTTSGDRTRDSSPVPHQQATTGSESSPKLAVKAFARKTFGRALKETTTTATKQPVQATKKPEATSTAAESCQAVVVVQQQRDSELVVIQPDNPIRESKIATLLVAKAPTEALLSASASAAQRSASKESLSSEGSRAHMSSSSGSQSGTSIPKPTAAVKGTTKVSKDDRRIAEVVAAKKSAGKPIVKAAVPGGGAKSSGAASKTDGCSQVDFGQLVAEMAPASSSSLLRCPGRSVGSPVNVSIAMVSPMPSAYDDGGRRPRPQPYVKVDVARAKMETTFDSTDDVITTTAPTAAAAKKETTFSEDNSDDVVVNIKPMQPLLRASPYGSYVRSLGGGGAAAYSAAAATTRAAAATAQHHASRFHGRQMVTTTVHHHDAFYDGGACGSLKRLASHYCPDVDAIDLSAGYMSDGDMLRAPGSIGGGGVGGFLRGGVDDIASGYLSEGGASLYSRRLQSRLREGGMATVREGVSQKTSSSSYLSEDCNRTPISAHVRHGLDDSSSVSSGLSDTIAEVSTDENLTVSSVSSEHNHQHNPYGSLKRTPHDVLRGNGSSSSDKGRKVVTTTSEAARGSKGSGSVRKADSAQQTETSSFRFLSSSKKEGGRGDLSSLAHVEKSDLLLRRGKSDLEGGGGRCRGLQPSPSSGSVLSSSSSSGILRKGTGSSSSDKKDAATSSSSPNSKRKLLVSRDEGGRQQQQHQDLRMDKSRSSSRGGGGEKVSGVLRTVAAAAASPVLGSLSSSRRPNSTCSVSSSTGSSSGGKSGGSLRGGGCKKTSIERLSELDVYDDVAARPAQSKASAHELSSSASLERRSRGGGGSRLNASSTQILQDLYGIGGGGSSSDVEYSSLGRRPKQQYSFGASTIPPPSSSSKDYSMIISNPHATYGGGSGRVGHHHHHHHHHGASGGGGGGPRLSLSSKDHDCCISEQQHPSPYSSWLRRSPSNVSSAASLPLNARAASTGGGGSLTEAESLESLASNASSSIQAQIQHARANSLTHACLLMHQQRHTTTTTPSPRLARSNSIRSTKSEKLYPSMMQRSEDLDSSYLGGGGGTTQMSVSVHASRPSSPTPESQSRFVAAYLAAGGSQSATSSPLHHHHGAAASSSSSRASSTIPSYVGNILSKMGGKDDDLHASTLSLASVTSSLYSTPEEKHSHEIRKLRRELADAHDKVKTLTSQLSTNNPWPSSMTAPSGGGLSSWQQQQHPQSSSSSACHSPDWQAHVVAAFEQSLSNMTNRLQALTHSAEQKDSELSELRTTIESLRKQSAEAGLTSANFPLLGAVDSPHGFRRRPSGTAAAANLEQHRMSRQLSTDSMSSVNSLSSACSVASHRSSSDAAAIGNCNSSKKKKKKGWLRSSFTKAFSRGKKHRNGSLSDVDDLRHQLASDVSAPNSPLLNGVGTAAMAAAAAIKTSHSSSAIYDKDDDQQQSQAQAPEVVKELKKQLREKDMVLTDIRLEALSSAHQLVSLKETVTKMRTEMLNLKHDNERLQRLVSTKSLTSSQSSLPTSDAPLLEKRLSALEVSTEPSGIDMMLLSDASLLDKDGKRVTVSVVLNGTAATTKGSSSAVPPEVVVGAVYVSAKTKWDLLESTVRRAFKDYVLRVDPVSNLGLNADSILGYTLGDVVVSKDLELPELLPCGYLVGDSLSLKVSLKGTKHNSIDSLAFDALIPKSIVQRYVSLLTEHRRIILCGPSGTGKTYLAHKLAEFLVLRSGKQLTPGSIATFNVDHKSAKELRQYLSNVAEQCESSNVSDLPSVIILDNLHHVGSLGEVFNGFLSAKYQKCPFIIGTMNHTTCSTTNLQLHHNFRWVLCANHMEPVKGFLGRYLRRKLLDVEVRSNTHDADLAKVVDWMPKVWQQLNKFLETHSSSDVTIGPRLFLSCPIDVSGSQIWFTDLWNYSVVPYLLEAVREGLQLYGRRAPWEDPTEWVIETYPWPCNGPTSVDWPALVRLRPEDVGYEGHPGPGGAGVGGGGGHLGAKSVCSNQSDIDGDPLFNMLMRLQEAASYSSPHSNDSDTTSLDSHGSSLQPDDALSGTGIESAL